MPRISRYIWSFLALSASSLASAQSSVTLFGVMDAGVSRYMVRSNAWDGSGRTASQAIWALSPSGNLREAAARLFSALHELDRPGIRTILAERVPDEGLGRAIMNRLGKAAASGSLNNI